MNQNEEDLQAGLKDDLDVTSPEQRLLAEKLARRIIRRTIWKLTMGSLRIFAILAIVYWVYQTAVSNAYSNMSIGQEFNRFVDTYIEIRYAGIRYEKRLYPPEINTFLTQSSKQRLYSDVGSRQVIIGEVTAKKPLFGHYQITMDLQESYLNEKNAFTFSVLSTLIYPDRDPRGVAPERSAPVWRQTRQIGDGYVAEMAFSTGQEIDPVELQRRLSAYDLHLLHMPVYSGEMRAFTEGLSKVEADGFVSTNPLMLRPRVDYGDGNGQGYGFSFDMWFFGRESVETAVVAFLKDLEWLQEHGGYQEAELDRQRIAYLKENGVYVYGAVVTGPIRELEKLQQEKDFGHFQLGRVEVWRWGQ